MAIERLQKILAQSGVTSRRKAEELIRDGQVTVNGKIAKLGDKAALGQDAIKVSGKLLRNTEAPVYLAFNKPKGVICAMSDPNERPTLKAYFSKIHRRLFPAGLLDFNSEGLVLLTNDGGFVAKLQKCEQLPKTYLVKIKGHIDDKMVGRLQRGAMIEYRNKKVHVKPERVWVQKTLEKKTQLKILVMNAGEFDIKGLFEAKRLLVEKITRSSIGHITLKGIAPGEFRSLKASQVEALIKQPELGLRDLPDRAQVSLSSEE